jgi:hypothetical protein
MYPRHPFHANIVLRSKERDDLLVPLNFRCTYLSISSHVLVGPADEKALGPFRSVKVIVQAHNAPFSFTYHLAIERA